MTVRRYTMSETTLFNQLFGSENFTNGGVGRSNKATVERCTTEARLIAAAAVRGAHVLLVGTDYVVVQAAASVRRVYAHPTGGA